MSVAETTLRSCQEIPWLSELPSHWAIERGKSLFQKMKRPVRDEDETVTAFRDGQVTLRKNRRLEGFTEAIQEHGYQGIRVGDLVIHSMDAFAGAIGVSDSDGKASPVYQVCKPIRKDVNSRYFALLVRQMSKNGFILALAKGIRERSTDFRFSDFGSQFYPLPPRGEQDAIVAFLDRKLADIDRFIANKRRMIVLLEEDFSLAVTSLVTGIESNSEAGLVEFVEKGSVNESSWTFRSPENWKRSRIKYLARINPTKSSVVGDLDAESLVSFVPMEIANSNDPDFSGSDRKLKDVESGFTSFADGDVLIAKITPCFENGKGGICENLTNGIGFGTTEFHVLRPKSSIQAEFLYYATISKPFRKLGASQMKGAAGQQRVPTDFIKEFVLPFPDLIKQKEIVDKIKRLRREFSDAKSTIDRELELLNEFRTALIAEAVTGKIDVHSS